MKKTISINISGIIFHIEEDGYDTLKKYLEAINAHFSHYKDNQEIISDIENRIAEIFLSNLKNNKQVISAENVQNLIEKMGTIADFKAMEEEEATAAAHQEQEKNEDFYKYITPPLHDGKGYKKLTRMDKKKVLGGVCAGIAHYFSIDPLWPRLVAILLLFSGKIKFSGSEFSFSPWDDVNLNISLGLGAVLAYVIMWVLLPVSYEDVEDKNIKKLYRNPDDRTLGGVASGLAAYFNTEVIWIRLLFIGLIFAGGAGLVIYIILWIITPQAKSITERIEMKGGAITLDNIESTIIESLNPGPIKEESQGRKILLAPFRFLGKAINTLGKAFGPLGTVLLAIIRIIFGLIITIIGMALSISAVGMLGAYFGLLPIVNNDNALYFEDIPAAWVSDILPPWLAASISVVLFIPGIVILLLGLSVLIKRSIIDAKFGLVALGIWLLGVGITAFHIPKVVNEFKTTAESNKEEVLKASSQTLVIRSEDSVAPNNLSERISLVIEGVDGDDMVLLQTLKARGKNREEALAYANLLEYNYQFKDSIITFERNVDLSKLSKYRGQSMELLLEIPYDKPFVMEKSLLPIIRGTIYKNGYKTRDVNSINHWVFNEDGLLCLTCTQTGKESAADSLSRSKFADAYFMRSR